MNSLDEREKDRIVNEYESRINEHGFDVAALKSGGLEKQCLRHSVHAGLFELDGRRVLDVGCGIGMFYQFLCDRGVSFGKYTGLDIVDSFLDHNRRLYPNAEFLNLDIFEDKIEDLEPDVVYMSQLFNRRYEAADNEEVACAAVRRLFEVAREGVVVDFMSTYVDYREEEHHYFAPETMLKFAKQLTRYASLRHDYLPFEFTLALRHFPSGSLPVVGDVVSHEKSQPGDD